MDELSTSGRVVVTACGETQHSYDGASDQQNGVFTYHYIDGLCVHHTVEEAYAHVTPLATAFIVEHNGADTDPQLYDQYS